MVNELFFWDTDGETSRGEGIPPDEQDGDEGG